MHRCRTITIPGDDFGEGLDLNLDLELEDATGISVRMHTRTSQPVGFGSYRLPDRLLLTTEGVPSVVIDYESHVIAGSMYIELKDTTRLDP